MNHIRYNVRCSDRQSIIIRKLVIDTKRKGETSPEVLIRALKLLKESK